MECTQQQEAISRKRKRKQEQKAISRKRKRKQEQKAKDGNIKHSSDNGGINELPNDVIINILSHTPLKEAARMSVLARRWRYLWRYASGIMWFGNRVTSSGKLMKKEKFESRVNTVLELHQARYVEGMAINYEVEGDSRSSVIIPSMDNWVYFATQKDVKMLEVNLSFYNRYLFPSVGRLRSNSHGGSAPLCRLRTLRLAFVSIKDKVFHYFLASCPNLEELCLHSSSLTKNVQVIDPPSLRVLEISRCCRLESLKISADDLVSFTYRGPRELLHLGKIPNLRELSIADCFAFSFFEGPKKRSSYSVLLEKLVLDFRFTDADDLECVRHVPQLCSLRRLEVFAAAGRTTLFYFRLLIKASPQLREFRIEMSYEQCSYSNKEIIPIFGRKAAAKAMKFVHRNLKVVEIGGYTGRLGEDELVRSLLKVGPSIERVVIDTEINYFDFDYYLIIYGRLKYADCPRQTKITRNKAKLRAKCFGSTLPSRIQFIVT